MPGEVARRVLDRLLEKAVEKAVHEHVAEDAEGGAADHDRAAAWVAQQVARRNQHEHRPAGGRHRAASPDLPGTHRATEGFHRIEERGFCGRIRGHETGDGEYDRRQHHAAIGARHRIDDVRQARHGAQPRLEGADVDAESAEVGDDRKADRVPGKQAGDTEQDRLEKHETEDPALAHAEGEQDPEFARALEHRHEHGIRDRHGNHDEEHEQHDVAHHFMKPHAHRHHRQQARPAQYLVALAQACSKALLRRAEVLAVAQPQCDRRGATRCGIELAHRVERHHRDEPVQLVDFRAENAAHRKPAA